MGRQAAFTAAVLTIIVCRGAEVTVPTSDPVALGKIANRFQKEIYPLLARESNHQESCVECHDTDNRSSLAFLGEPGDDFEMLLENGYLAMQGPDTLLSRVMSENPQRRMPKGKTAEPWTNDDIERLKAFLRDLNHNL